MSLPFFDTNILLYLVSDEAGKADRVEKILGAGGQISVQVLAELTAVCRRKFAMDWRDIDVLRRLVMRHCRVHPLTIAVHDAAFALARSTGYRIYDSQIIAAAIRSGATTLWSEDMQAGQQFGPLDDSPLRLTIVNPFAT